MVTLLYSVKCPKILSQALDLRELTFFANNTGVELEQGVVAIIRGHRIPVPWEIVIGKAGGMIP